MKPQFMIKQTGDGYGVYYQSKTWYGKTTWKPYITHVGTEDMFYFSTYKQAADELKIQVFYYSICG